METYLTFSEDDGLKVSEFIRFQAGLLTKLHGDLRCTVPDCPKWWDQYGHLTCSDWCFADHFFSSGRNARMRFTSHLDGFFSYGYTFYLLLLAEKICWREHVQTRLWLFWLSQKMSEQFLRLCSGLPAPVRLLVPRRSISCRSPRQRSKSIREISIDTKPLDWRCI